MTSLPPLSPSLLVQYERQAFMGVCEEGPLRLTLDRSLLVQPAVEWGVREPTAGQDILPGGVVLELKYRGLLPVVFRRLLQETGLVAGAMSKYRRGVETTGLGDGACRNTCRKLF